MWSEIKGAVFGTKKQQKYMKKNFFDYDMVKRVFGNYYKIRIGLTCEKKKLSKVKSI